MSCNGVGGGGGGAGMGREGQGGNRGGRVNSSMLLCSLCDFLKRVGVLVRRVLFLFLFMILFCSCSCSYFRAVNLGQQD